MKATIKPSQLKGKLTAPASKSSMQRALAAALLAKGETIIKNPGNSKDDEAALEIIQRLGATIERIGDELKIVSRGIAPIADSINCGESGLSIRMFTPIAALAGRKIHIDGSGSLKTRPMNFFENIFPSLGISFKSNNGKLPLEVSGPLQPVSIEIDGSLSSQFLTGMLMAYSYAGAAGVSIRVKNLASRPYIDMTLDVLKQFGLKVPVNNNYEEFVFEKNNLGQKAAGHVGTLAGARTFTVEADWSSASFLLVAGVIAGPITITGLDLLSLQADRKIFDVLMNINADISVDAKGIRVGPSYPGAFEFDATDCPDLFPPLVALAAYCEGETIIKGVQRLEHKESDRGISLQNEFYKLGIEVSIEDDCMHIKGSRQVKGGVVHSHQDHRIAMALAIAALGGEGSTVIEDADAVNKSYPGFFDDLEKLGAGVSLSNKIRLHE